jgi:hypothetical protein
MRESMYGTIHHNREQQHIITLQFDNYHNICPSDGFHFLLGGKGEQLARSRASSVHRRPYEFPSSDSSKVGTPFQTSLYDVSSWCCRGAGVHSFFIICLNLPYSSIIDVSIPYSKFGNCLIFYLCDLTELQNFCFCRGNGSSSSSVHRRPCYSKIISQPFRWGLFNPICNIRYPPPKSGFLASSHTRPL